MVRTTIAFAFASSLLAAAPAAAQSVADVRCLVLSNAFAQGASKAEAKQAAQSSAFYYLGKIDGRWSDAQLSKALLEQARSIKLASAGGEMQECARRMQASAVKLQSLAPKPAQLVPPKK